MRVRMTRVRMLGVPTPRMQCILVIGKGAILVNATAPGHRPLTPGRVCPAPRHVPKH